jgi:hypothetical protein
MAGERAGRRRRRIREICPGLFPFGTRGRVARLAGSIFWLTLPSLSFFLALGLLLQQGTGFAAALAVSILVTIAFYGAMLLVLHKLGMAL